MPDRDRLDNLLAVLATGLADEQRRTMAATSGLSENGVGALVALEQILDGSRVADLAAVLGVTHSGAVRLVDQLVAAGLVRRTPLGDGRAVGVRLSARGRREAARARAARAATAGHLTAGLSDRQRADLERLLDRLVGSLTATRLERRRSGAAEPWLCRTCDLVACGRPDGRCPAATTATATAGH
jgi:DNA-binding MarR family transcriptional regulator